MEFPEGLRFSDNEKVREKIVSFIRDYVQKAGVNGVTFGLSGGIDSALVAALAAQAIDPSCVRCILMPVDASKDQHVSDAKEIAKSLGINYEMFELRNVIKSFDPLKLEKVALGNLMARVRMVVLYAKANQNNLLVLGTGNKSELMIGYFTKYGDGGADILPIADLYKVNVRELARHVNVPEHIVTKVPTAGLWAGQTDEGEIGVTYNEIDTILFLHIERKYSPDKIKAYGVDSDKVDRVLGMMARSQHKRTLLPKPIMARHL
jgi:NAD+ synthase